jgi:hypothetical protein
VLGSARSFAAIGEWAADVPVTVLAAQGAVHDPFTGIHRVQDATTIGRVLADLDGDAFDTAITRWLMGLHARSTDQPPPRLRRGQQDALVDHSWQNPSHVCAGQGPAVTVTAVRKRTN